MNGHEYGIHGHTWNMAMNAIFQVTNIWSSETGRPQLLNGNMQYIQWSLRYCYTTVNTVSIREKHILIMPHHTHMPLYILMQPVIDWMVRAPTASCRRGQLNKLLCFSINLRLACGKAFTSATVTCRRRGSTVWCCSTRLPRQRMSCAERHRTW